MWEQAETVRDLMAQYDEHSQAYGAARDPEAAARHAREQAFKRQAGTLQRLRDAGVQRLEARRAAHQALVAQVQETEALLDEQRGCLVEMEKETGRLAALETPENKADLALLLSLLSLHEKLQEQERQFRAHCKQQRAELAAALEDAEATGGLTPAQRERLLQVESAFLTESARLDKLRQQLAQASQHVHALRRRLGDVPARSELMQYERRFAELYEQAGSKLEEARSGVSRYNSLTDALKFLNKELSILSSILANYPSASRKDASMTAFLDQMQSINSNAQDTLAKVKGKQEDAARRRDTLSDALNKELEKQRRYFSLVQAFQQSCAEHDGLVARLGAARPAVSVPSD